MRRIVARRRRTAKTLRTEATVATGKLWWAFPAD
jgi:hypothetical protein